MRFHSGRAVAGDGGERDGSLLQLWESVIFGLWPRGLLIFEDGVEMVYDGPLQTYTVSWPYASIKRVRVFRGAWFVSLIVEGEDGTMLMRGIEAKEALRAKELLEERI